MVVVLAFVGDATVFAESGWIAGLLMFLPIPVLILGYKISRGSRGAAVLALLLHLMAVIEYHSDTFAWEIWVGFRMFIKLDYETFIVGIDLYSLLVSLILMAVVITTSKGSNKAVEVTLDGAPHF